MSTVYIGPNNQINSSGFDNVDPYNHTHSENLLHHGVPNDKSTNLFLRHLSSELFADKKAYGYERSIEVIFSNFTLASAGNFNKVSREQNNAADMKYSDVILILSSNGDLANKIMDALNRGTVFSFDGAGAEEGLQLCRLVRVGGLQVEDKLKISEVTAFHKVKFTYFEQDPTTGLIYTRFEYEHFRQTITRFGEDGEPEGINIAEARLADNAPGLLR